MTSHCPYVYYSRTIDTTILILSSKTVIYPLYVSVITSNPIWEFIYKFSHSVPCSGEWSISKLRIKTMTSIFVINALKQHSSSVIAFHYHHFASHVTLSSVRVRRSASGADSGWLYYHEDWMYVVINFFFFIFITTSALVLILTSPTEAA